MTTDGSFEALKQPELPHGAVDVGQLASTLAALSEGLDAALLVVTQSDLVTVGALAEVEQLRGTVASLEASTKVGMADLRVAVDRLT